MFQEQAPSCVLKFALRERVSGAASSLVCTGWGTYPGACFRSKLLRVYWLENLPGSVFRERVSGASSLACTGLKGSCNFENFQNHSHLLITNCTRGRAISYTNFTPIHVYPSLKPDIFLADETRQSGWVSCLAAVGRVTLAGGTTFLHISSRRGEWHGVMLGLLHMSPVNWAGPILETSPRHSL